MKKSGSKQLPLVTVPILGQAPRPKTHRLFFALWPDWEIRQSISQGVMPYLDDVCGRKVSQQQWHITLAFLGHINDDIVSCIQHQADKVTGQAFELTLDTLGHWSRPKVVWLGCASVPEAMRALVNSLNTELQGCGYEPEYQDFKAHMTLMRKVTRRPGTFEFNPIHWAVNQFVLIESQMNHHGSKYQVIRQWDLSV